MSSQYDTIQAPYDILRQISIALIERENVRTAISPFIKTARVLDLACGSGFYTHSFLEWGASSVLGVDLSPTMIEAARRLCTTTISPSSSPSSSSFPPTSTTSSRENPVDFLLADCSKPTPYPTGPFDLVFGAWLLNYAPDRPTLASMFLNISRNLKPGGRFVSVTCPPTDDPTASIDAELKARPPPEGSGGLAYEKLHDVEDGVYFHAHGETEAGNVDFECWHLRKAVYEEAAREAGLRGMWEWGVTRVPGRWLNGEEREGGASMEELRSYETVPNYGVLVVGK